MPISIKFGDQQSTYSIAVQAKAKLLEHIREILKNDATKMPQEDNSSKRNGKKISAAITPLLSFSVNFKEQMR